MATSERMTSILGALLMSAGLASGQVVKENPRDGLAYVFVPKGIMVAGCSVGDTQCFGWEDAPKEVEMLQGFWIGQTEATQEAFQSVMGSNPSLYIGRSRPADQVSWNDAVRYCAAIGMRLPTESEWEFAARGGKSTSTYGSLDEIAWADSNSGDQTHPVAQKQPNAFGLYDMLGNVWEWVQNSYRQDPAKRILRGGSFFNLARDLRVSNRLWATPETAHRNMGFRCAGGSVPSGQK